METIDTNAAASEPKLCINCKHIGTNSSGDWTKYKCFAPQNMSGLNPVDGHKEYTTELCKDTRANNYTTDFISRNCGLEGVWYEPKPSTNRLTRESDLEISNAIIAAKVQAIKARQRSSGTNLLEDLGL